MKQTNSNTVTDTNSDTNSDTNTKMQSAVTPKNATGYTCNNHSSYQDGLPYYSVNRYLRQTYNQKLYKLSLNGGFTCPNRDGTLETRGCIFCSEKGSGDFSESAFLPISEQIELGKKRLQNKYKNGKYIGYFQSFTNTYGTLTHLEDIYMQAVSHPDIQVLSIATRPDCITSDIIMLLKKINAIKPVWIELGLQTTNETSAEFIRRGYPLSVYDDCVYALHEAGIPVITHVILGLPGETLDTLLETIAHINSLPVWGIKLQLLHILQGTDLATYYKEQPFPVLTLDEYCYWLSEAINTLREDIVIHRLTGDGPKSLLIEPKWSANKKNVLNTVNQYFRTHGTRQGGKYA